MSEDLKLNVNTAHSLDGYKFSGLDASLVGAINSVADYYRIDASTTWLYGITGIAFLHILDENLVEPNGGPVEPDVFRLIRHIGIDIQGLHQYAEGDRFPQLQKEMWEKAKLAIDAGQPVFAKNLDIANQTSIITAYDEDGYYTDSWHTGEKLAEEAIPWNHLGLSRCTCINCVQSRNKTEASLPAKAGLISLHWATTVPAADSYTSFKESLAFVIRLNDEEQYTWAGKTYTVGNKAHKKWLAALDADEVDGYFFSLFLEVLKEARRYAALYLTEAKEKLPALNPSLLDDCIEIYNQIAADYSILGTMYPYTEPPVRQLKEKERCIKLINGLMNLENEALAALKKIFADLI
ncbi:hypothetical protein [Paenibacillus radicis (ex Gao et al. 2016)]|uniref:Uncharacterized protein n=1 Tax=Paenibacillus radicis (ex Gao et al. 2016) TaxID=1737354 RepID=A0A917HGP5_9BACL|nr:hypothetical protein [Paenibacillus radicis (ex Gao et al. 2016)]GGG77519.1 hypothetical protein GCM10010918_37770 [Paenibacillus radicis (ex Gao et al. 2016)]